MFSLKTILFAATAALVGVASAAPIIVPLDAVTGATDRLAGHAVNGYILLRSPHGPQSSRSPETVGGRWAAVADVVPNSGLVDAGRAGVDNAVDTNANDPGNARVSAVNGGSYRSQAVG